MPGKGETSQISPVFEGAIERALGDEPLDQGELEALLLAKGRELSMLLLAADALRRSLVGDLVTYVVNRNINFTNVCTCKCTFCGFARDAEDPDSYLLTMDQVRKKVREARAFGATEICLQGGINPNVDLEYFTSLLKVARDELPEVHIHAFSPMEIDHVARRAGLSIGETLSQLMDSGLGSMPGTAAEILVDRVRQVICPRKITADRWEEIILAAHGLGLPTTATMMYGTVETVADRARHLIRLREIQERTSGFTEFVPLPFVHGVAPISKVVRSGPTGADDLRMIAASRLAFGSALPNIQVSWVKMGIKLAQIGLAFGANDFGGTLMEENISKSAGSTAGTVIEPERIRDLIRDIGRVPVQRDTIYNHLR